MYIIIRAELNFNHNLAFIDFVLKFKISYLKHLISCQAYYESRCPKFNYLFIVKLTALLLLRFALHLKLEDLDVPKVIQNYCDEIHDDLGKKMRQ